MGIRKAPLAVGIVAGIGLFVYCVMQLMAGVINMAVIFGVAGVAVMELAVMVSVIHRKPSLQSAGQIVGSKAGTMSVDTMAGHDQSGLFVAPQPSMGHVDLRMDTASSHRENTGIYIESEELMTGGHLQKLVYGNKNAEKKPKKAPAKKTEGKRLVKAMKVKAKTK